MKTDTVFKQAYNALIDRISPVANGATLPSENELSAALQVSRTTVRKVLASLASHGYVEGDGRDRTKARSIPEHARFPETETVPTSAQVERLFMEWILRGDTKPGALINELELARAFGIGTTAIREFLNQFRRFGLIEKRPNAGWLFKGFTEDFAIELFEIRELFELRSARAFVALDASAPQWTELTHLKQEHLDLLADIDQRYNDFSALDSRLHRLISSAAPNRFIHDFYDIIALVFHYHYQWNKHDERQRNAVAIVEHLAFIDALMTRDRRQVEVALRQHMTSARKSMVASSTPMTAS